MLFARPADSRRNLRGISVAVIAAALACIGLGLAAWQSLSSRARAVQALRAHAATIARLVATDLSTVLRDRFDTVTELSAVPDPTPPPAPKAPPSSALDAGSALASALPAGGLITALAAWDASTGWVAPASAQPTQAQCVRAEPIVRNALDAARDGPRVQDATGAFIPDDMPEDDESRGGITYVRLGDADSQSADLLAVRPLRHATGRVYAAWLRTGGIISMLGDRVRRREPALELASASTAPWSERLPDGLAFLCVQPTSATLQADRDARFRVALLLGPVSLVSVTALVGLIWRMALVMRREEELSKLKDDFVAGVSHELKTPLSLIHLFAETLLEGRVPTDDKRREYYDVILRESARLTHLINNLLDFSRLQTGRRPFELTPQDVGAVVRGVYDAYHLELDHARMSHSLTIEPALPLIAMDRDAIGQAVLNLMSNAVKYSQNEREMRIEVAPDVRRGRRGVLISVYDRGIGIAPHERDRVFEGFFRGSDPRVRARRGTGVGLALVRHIVDMHGGIVSAESRLAGGTTFRIFLPAAETAA